MMVLLLRGVLFLPGRRREGFLLLVVVALLLVDEDEGLRCPMRWWWGGWLVRRSLFLGGRGPAEPLRELESGWWRRDLGVPGPREVWRNVEEDMDDVGGMSR